MANSIVLPQELILARKMRLLERPMGLEAISRPQITFEGKAQVGEKAEHTC
jgi:hypothetical protein